MFVDDKDVLPVNQGVDDGTFFDSDSPLSFENTIAEELYSPNSTPVGPHNMQNNRNVFDRVRRQQKGN